MTEQTKQGEQEQGGKEAGNVFFVAADPMTDFR